MRLSALAALRRDREQSFFQKKMQSTLLLVIEHELFFQLWF